MHELRGTLRAIGTTLRASATRQVAASVLYRMVALILLAPLAAIVLRLVIATSGDRVVADEDILGFVLTPVGFSGLVLAAAAALTVTVLEQACLVLIAWGSLKQQPVSVFRAVRFVVLHGLTILAVVARVVVFCVAVALPFLAVAGLTWSWLLTEHDINYYLAEQPAEFLQACVIAGLLTTGYVVIVLPTLAGWLSAIPLLMFEETPYRSVLSVSTRRMDGQRWRAVRLLILWFVIAFILGGLNLGLVAFLAKWLIPLTVSAPGALVLVLGLLFLCWLAGGLLISVAQSVVFGTCLTHIYLPVAADGAQIPAELRVQPSEAGPRDRITMRRTVWALTALLVLTGVLGAFLIETTRIDDDVMVIAHRGAGGLAPENTLASVRRAVEDGADVVEIDVQETADGEVVVIHDSDLMKVAGVPLKIRNATIAQLADLDVGSHFDPTFQSERVPLLREVLELCRGKAIVDIELKYYGFDVQLEQRVADIVEAEGMADNVILMSLSFDGVRKMKQLRPDWTVGLLTATAVGDLTSRDADFLAVNSGMCTPSFIRKAHRRGKPVYVWTVNNSTDMARFASLGVDGLITDFPATARDVILARDEMNPAERLLVNLAFRFEMVPRTTAPEKELRP